MLLLVNDLVNYHREITQTAICIFKFRGNVWEYRKGSLIVTYCDEYLHIRSK